MLISCGWWRSPGLEFDGSDDAALSRNCFPVGIELEIFLEVDEPPFVEAKNVVSHQRFVDRPRDGSFEKAALSGGRRVGVSGGFRRSGRDTLQQAFFRLVRADACKAEIASSVKFAQG